MMYFLSISRCSVVASLIILTLLCIAVVTAESLAQDTRCIGLYCGRVLEEDGNYSECKACPRGHTVNNLSMCIRCTDTPTFYDWMYLAFLPVISLCLHFFFIEITNRRKHARLLILHSSAVIESVCASLFTLLVLPPRGSLDLTSCRVKRLSDWYTLFHNPRPDYVNEVHCTHEAIYPLYTAGFVYCCFGVAMLMLLRPLVSVKFVWSKGTKSIYAALYFFPLIVCIHTVFAGFIYYSFAYIILVASVISSAVHFSRIRRQISLHLLKVHITDARNIAVLLCHWAVHAFGIIALTQLKDPTFHSSLISLVPLPAIFYILTVKFTDPSKLDHVAS